MNYPLQYQGEYLREFWKLFGIRREVSHHSKDDVINELCRAGEIVLRYNARPLYVRRSQWNAKKVIRTRMRFMGNDKCFACGSTAECRHHIIWLKNGGWNIRRNICFLCNSCHSEIHPWRKNR